MENDGASQDLAFYVVTEPCIDVLDQGCITVCPVDCIHIEEGVDRMVVIDPDECIDCHACVPECPVNAIHRATDVPADQQRYIELNARWFEDRDEVRRTIDEWAPRS